MAGHVDKNRKYICESCKLLPKPPPQRECPPCRRVKLNAWYANSERNRVKSKLWMERWRAENREKYLQIQRNWHRKRFIENPEVVRAVKKDWTKKNPWYNAWKGSKQRYGEYAESHRILLALEGEIRKVVRNENQSTQVEETRPVGRQSKKRLMGHPSKRKS